MLSEDGVALDDTLACVISVVFVWRVATSERPYCPTTIPTDLCSTCVTRCAFIIGF